jgi:SM-20-related protein
MAKLFPYLLFENFLDIDLNKDILNYAIENEVNFVVSSVSKSGSNVYDSELCESKTLYNMGPSKSIFQEKIAERIPEMASRLQISPFKPGKIEVQIGAYGDGSFFLDHIDTVVHEKSERPRVISAIYYFHSTPKRFTGGELRLHPLPFGQGSDEPVDIIPKNNSLLVFPSIAPHEVLPIHAKDIGFKDWRFAINCWVHKE